MLLTTGKAALGTTAKYGMGGLYWRILHTVGSLLIMSRGKNILERMGHTLVHASLYCVCSKMVDRNTAAKGEELSIIICVCVCVCLCRGVVSILANIPWPLH